MKLSGFILLIILILPTALFAQVENEKLVLPDSSSLFINKLESGQVAGTVKVVQDPRLTRILRKQYEFNRTRSVSGYSILIYKGREMSRGNAVKAEYEEAFSSLGLIVRVEYNEPDFATLVGAFRTKEDAYRYKQKLIVRFPQAYLVEARLTIE